MDPGENLQVRWQELLTNLSSHFNQTPDLDSILTYIGKKEAGLPDKILTEKEKTDLQQLAICTLLVPDRYFELFWVDDTGWPHFKQLKSLPVWTSENRSSHLQSLILLYAQKNKWCN